MVNLQLTNKEWYFLHVQLEKLIKENPHNYIPKEILSKLSENRPNLTDIKADFAKEYECEWIDKRQDCKHENIYDTGYVRWSDGLRNIYRCRSCGKEILED